MKGDFSRLDFGHHFSLGGGQDSGMDRLLLQQGRVTLDAHWNAQAQADLLRHRQALADLIGPAGAPAGNPGFGLWSRTGLSFDGERHAFEIRSGEAHRIDGPFAIEVWLRLSEGDGGTIISRPAGEGGGFRLVIANGRLYFDIVDRQQPPSWYRVATDSPLPLGRFIHLVVAVERRSIRLFVDGQLEAQVRGRPIMPFATLPLLIGCDMSSGRAERFFRGALEHLRLWRHRRIHHGRFDEGSEMLCDWLFVLDEEGRLIDHGRCGHHGHPHGHHHSHPHYRPAELWIGAGRCYLEGVASDNPRDVRYESQPDCPGLSLEDLQHHRGSYLAFLQSWDRVVTAIEDESLRETALGGGDTALKTRVVSQVRLWPLPENSLPILPEPERRGCLRLERTEGVPLAENHLYRIEIHQSGYAAADPKHPWALDQGLEVVAIERRGGGGELGVVVREQPGDEPAGFHDRLVELSNSLAGLLLSGRVVLVTRDHPGLLNLSLIVEGRDAAFEHCFQEDWLLRPIATAKWSEDNGAWAFAVTGLSEEVVSLANPACMDGVLKIGDWVEVTDDVTILRRIPTELRRIIGIEGEGDTQFRIELDQPFRDPLDRDFSAISPHHPLLRRWEAIADLGSLPLKAEAAVVLKGGVTLSFGHGRFEAEDYWAAPLRHQLEWPADSDGAHYLPPFGPEIRRTELAEVEAHHGGLEVRDLRKIFQPLTRGERVVERERPPVPRGIVEDRHHPEEPKPFAVTYFEEDDVLPEEEIVDLSSGEELPDFPEADIEPVEVLPEEKIAPAIIIAAGWRRLTALLPFSGSVIATGVGHQIFCLWPNGAAVLFDPRHGDGHWTDCASPPIGDLSGAVAVTLEGHVHVLALAYDGERPRSVHLRYAPEQDEWRELPVMPTLREDFSVVAMAGELIVVGGRHPGKRRALRAVEAYLPGSEGWRRLPDMPKGLHGAAAAVVAGRLYLFGGTVDRLMGFGHRLSDLIQIHAIGDGHWSKVTALATARTGAMAAALGDWVFLVGGGTLEEELCPMEVFEAGQGRMQQITQPPSRRWDCGLAVAGGVLYLLGGLGANAESTIDAYRPDRG